jgi:predicted ribosome quality control (RQC) complex YloA/Tae2 family protein
MVLKLEEGEEIYLCREGNEAFLSFFPMGHVLEEFTDLLSASNRYYQKFWQVNRFHTLREAELRRLQIRAADLHHQIGMVEAHPVSGRRDYRLMADLLMAYGHNLPSGMEKVSMPAFDGSGTVEIPLKKDLSISGNAERFYRKARGQQEDERRYQQNLENLRGKYREVHQLIQKVSETTDLRSLRRLLPAEEDQSGKAMDPELPFHVICFMNFEIRVGKNARSNDELLRMSHKDDLWLHARDVPGSHVIIRTNKGLPVPVPVQERAASLAAAYSRSGKESLVPVMITERKYVRKIKGAAPGLVKVERSKTLLAAPQRI